MSDPTCSNSLSGRNEETEESQVLPIFKYEIPESKTKKVKAVVNREIEEIPTQIFTNSVDGITKLAENIEINSDDDSDSQKHESLPITSTKKKSRKRERKKAPQVQIPGANQNVPQSAESPHPNASTSSVHDLFLNQITPLYAVTNSRYLENLSHHPQFNLMQTQHFRQVIQRQFISSLSNTPLLHYSTHIQYQYQTFSYPSTPEPRYLQNLMQHPLLSQSFNNHQNINYIRAMQMRNATNSNQIIKDPKDSSNRNNLKKNQNQQDKLFSMYLSSEDVEKGLKSNTLIEGVLRINPKQSHHAYVSGSDKSEQDVLIDGVKNRNRALEGDIVIVQFIENETMDKNTEEIKQKLGKVVYIKERVHTRTCIGSLKLMADKNKQKALFVPRDYRIPRLNIPALYWPDNFYEKAAEYENTLFLAKIIDWFDVRFALGKIVCNIGMAGDMQSETKAILAQTDLDTKPYGPEFKHLYPGLDYNIPDEEIKLREDCRNLCIFSIDPYNCRDIDDAVSSRKLENGNYEIGVHISDVSHFLTEGTPLDEKVADKATTIYMVERAYHMLPDELCMLCSLLPGVDKLAFSVFWEITPDGQVLNHRFTKTVINSCCQLAYEHAQSVLHDKVDIENNFPEIYNNFKFKDVYETIKILGNLSSIFRKRRFDGGALRIDQPKMTFKLSPVNGLPESFSIYQSQESHQLIEEFMLLANMTVAERIYADHPKLAFLRCHPPPSIYMLNQLAKALKPIGIDLEVATAGHLHKSLLKHVGPDNTDRGKAMVINMLCAKPMARAKYFCAGCYDDEFTHYALNVPLYTHFTSPIRRYADIMVHRLLAASLKYREPPKWESDKVQMIAAQCNKQKYNAKKAGELSTELYTLKYIELHSPLVTEAVVVDVREKYLDVIIVAMGLSRRIFFNNDFPGEYNCVKNEAGLKLSKMEVDWYATDSLPRVKQVIEVFSILNVEMHKGDEMVKVETKLMRPQ